VTLDHQRKQVRRLDGYIKLRDHRAANARSRARCSRTASRASSRSRASTSTPRSASTCSTRQHGRARHDRLRWARRWATHGVNIANFQLGRDRKGGDAIALLYVDELVSQDVLDKLTAHHAIKQAKPLVFNVD
jgi:hypothetical protein